MAGLNAYRGKLVGVLGIARSGLAVTRALVAAGATVFLYDDSEEALEAGKSAGGKVDTSRDIATLHLVIASPGVPLSHPAPHPLIERARASGVPITGDIDLFMEIVGPRTIVGITGTNGKSTTAALVHHLLTAGEVDAVLGGNIGKPVFDLELGDDRRMIVLELSSFQLDLCQRLRCRVAVWLNLTPDHLDRHGDLEGYITAKRRIFQNMDERSTSVIAIDDEPSQRVALDVADLGHRVVRVSGAEDPSAEVFVRDQQLVDRLDGEERIVAPLSDIRSLRGSHNFQNAVAAYAVLRALGLPPDRASRGLSSFPGLPHRMEQVGRIGNVVFINDSKATNPESATKSLASFDDIYWIAGGKPKPGGFSDLLPFMSKVRKAFLIGQAAQELAETLADRVPVVSAGALKHALSMAYAAAKTESPDRAVVLLAPACASFDQFRSFEHRGDTFRRLVTGLAKLEGARA